jgi:hypothetical protein
MSGSTSESVRAMENHATSESEGQHPT